MMTSGPHTLDRVTVGRDALEHVTGEHDTDTPGPRQLSLSPSRAADFKNCPLLYRFRSIDRLPEPPSAAATRGTLVHAVLERLYELPAAGRSPEAALALVEPEWLRLLGESAELGGLFASDAEREEWLASVRALLAGYFELEDPRRLEPAARESLVEAQLDGELMLRGYIDRLDVTPAGDVRVVDYKTGTTPGESFEAKALFQLKFYALLVWRTRGVVPRQLRLVYLRSKQLLDYTPTEQELLASERLLRSLAEAISAARNSGSFPARPGKLCSWCPHQALCPAHGGTPPDYPMPDGLRPALAAPTTDSDDRE